MRIKRFIVLLILVAISFELAIGQEFSSVNYSISDGLPSNETYQVTQDNKGYIWIATDRGPCRFDGENFKTYGVKDGLPDPTVFSIIPWGDTILFRCFNQTIYALINDSVQLLPAFAAAREHAKTLKLQINDVAIDSSNSLIIGFNSYQGVSAVHFRFENLHQYKEVSSKTLRRSETTAVVNYKYSDRNNSILSFHNFMNTKDSIQFIFPDTNFYLEQNSASIRTYYSCVKLGVKQYLFFFGNQLLELKNGELITILDSIKSEVVIGSLSKIDTHQIAFGNRERGLYIIDRSFDSDQWNLTKSTEIIGASKTFVDKEGSWWISTLGSGIYKITNPTIKNIPMQEHGNRKVNTISVSKKDLWVGLSNGELLRYNTARPDIPIEKFKDNLEVFDSQVIRDSIWVSFVNVANDDIHFLHNKINYIRANTGLTTVNIENNIWSGGNHYVRLVDTRNSNTTKYETPVKTRLVLELPSKELFLATLDGMILAKRSSGTLDIIKTSLEGYRISYIEPYTSGICLVGTVGRGLILFNYLTDSILDQFEAFNGVDYSNIPYIKKGFDNFWIASNAGVAVVKIERNNYNIRFQKSYTQGNGLISNVVNQIDFGPDDVYVATDKGISYFDSSFTFNNLVPPDIFINKVETFGDSSFAISSNQALDWKFNNIKIDFTGLSFKSEKGPSYSYKLYGKSSENILTTQSSVSFLNLNPGNYQFEVFATNSSGIMSTQPATFNFIILPPFYQTNWFYLLVALFILLFVYSIYRFQINRLKTKNKNEIAFNELRQKALIAQMNPHFIFNSMNSILSLIMENKNAVAEDYLTQFSGLLRNALNQSEEAFTSLNDEIKITKEYIRLENLRFNYSITCQVKIPKNIDRNTTLVPSLLLQTLAENAILHGIIPAHKDGVIKLVLTKKNNQLLTVQVIDNGIGLNEAKRLKITRPVTHESKGTNILSARIQTLAQIHNLDCTVKFEDTGEGTQVTMNLPFFIDQEEKKKSNS